MKSRAIMSSMHAPVSSERPGRSAASRRAHLYTDILCTRNDHNTYISGQQELSAAATEGLERPARRCCAACCLLASLGPLHAPRCPRTSNTPPLTAAAGAATPRCRSGYRPAAGLAFVSPAAGLAVSPAAGLAVSPAAGLAVSPAAGPAVSPAAGLAVSPAAGLAFVSVNTPLRQAPESSRQLTPHGNHRPPARPDSMVQTRGAPLPSAPEAHH